MLQLNNTQPGFFLSNSNTCNILPILSRATSHDFEAIYEIWMQKHVLPFLGFEETPKEEFRPIFESIMNSSELYVLKKENRVVAVKRIIPGKGQHHHTVELGSFAVHQDHCGKGYGALFYELLLEKIKKEKPWVQRIEQGQTTDNIPAFQLALKMQYCSEVIFPDRPRRKTGPKEYTDKWHVGARYLTFILDPIIHASIKHTEKFSPAVPNLNPSKTILNDIKIDMNENGQIAVCYFKDKKIATFSFVQGVRRFSHIQFWEWEKEPDADMHALEICFRKLAYDASQHCKKIEIFSSDKDSTELLKNLGGHYCGTKKGACKIDDKYFDEIAVNISFFNIKDALALMELYLKDNKKAEKIVSSLIQCRRNINHALVEKQIDHYGALFLENMIFQMMREGLGESFHDPQPWPELIQQLPETINRENFMKLNEVLFAHIKAKNVLNLF